MNPIFNPFNQQNKSQNPNFHFKNIQKTLTDFQNHCSNFLNSQNHNVNNILNQNFNNVNHNFSNVLKHNFNLNPSTVKTYFENCIKEINSSVFFIKAPPLAFISQFNDNIPRRDNKALVSRKGASKEAIEEMLFGVPVYVVIEAKNKLALVLGNKPGVSLGLFCFNEEDAKALSSQIKLGMKDNESEVVEMKLSKVIQLKRDGVAFRLIPELNQIKHALKLTSVERKKAGIKDDNFRGVPVFENFPILETFWNQGCESESFKLWKQGKECRTVFFRKEDLEKSLKKKAAVKKRTDLVYTDADIEVAVLEDIINGMKECAMSPCPDVIFIPPGFIV